MQKSRIVRLCEKRIPRIFVQRPVTPFYLVRHSNISPYESHIDSQRVGVPPKSPDHQNVNTSRISTQTHREAHSPTMSEDVWHGRHLRGRSAGTLVTPQRLILVHIHLLTLLCLDKALRKRVLGWLAGGRHADVSSDIKQALHIGMATRLSPSV